MREVVTESIDLSISQSERREPRVDQNHKQLEIQKIEWAEIEQLSRIASAVVKEHFDPIIGVEQNNYMIARFQSVSAIQAQFQSGYQYDWVKEDGAIAGFLAFYPVGDKMYLSKFYTRKEYRGHHLARPMIDFVRSEAKKAGLTAIFLNVNRHNSDVIRIYEHLGFYRIREEKNDIGNGFYMDDFILECSI